MFYQGIIFLNKKDYKNAASAFDISHSLLNNILAMIMNIPYLLKISLFTYFAIFLIFLNFNDTLAADELLDIALDAFIPAFAPFPTYDPGT